MGAAIQKTLMLALGGLLFSPCLHAGQVLQQCGQGNMTVGSKQVGVATLWMQDCKQPWQAQNKRLQFDYKAKIPAWAFKKAANVILARNLSDQQWKQDKAQFEQITQSYQPIQPGDRYTLYYDASAQTLTLSLNDTLQVTTTGQLFDQYFLIWFGDKPFNGLLKKQLLGM